jgi:hypothetical protein
MNNRYEVALNSSRESRELTVDALDQAGGGMLPLLIFGAFAFGYCMGFAGAALYEVSTM